MAPPFLRLLILAGAVGGCVPVDADQARICRMALPALETSGTRVSLIRTERADGGVRVLYRAVLPAGQEVERFATCRFGPASRVELSGVTTDRGEVAGATLFLLKRYYLDSPEGIAADPGPPDPAASLPEWPPALARLGQHLAEGASGAALYGLLAAAYGLVFGLAGRVNLAFGELAAIGAAAAGLIAAGLAAFAALPVAIGAGLAVAVSAAALHGLVAGAAAFALVRGAQASLIATVGLSLVLSEYLRIVGGPVRAWIPPFGPEPWRLARAGDVVVTLAPAAALVTATGLGLGLALVLWLCRSRFGRRWRAAAEDPMAAALCGTDWARMLAGTLLLSGAAAGAAGALAAIRWGALGFADGFGFGLKALAGAILGGVGSVPGAWAGGLLIGLFETLWSAYGPIAGRDLALYGALVAAIVLRPEGLFAPPRA